MGVKEVQETVTEHGHCQCSPIRDPTFVCNCPEYTLTTPFHHEIVKKEGFRLKSETSWKTIDVMKQNIKCVIESKEITEGPSKGQTYYVGICAADGAPTKHRSFKDPEDEPCA